MGVHVDDQFRPLYVLISGKQAIITQLKAELRDAQELILATDEDREGEAISWHLTEVLKPSIPIKRAVFHEITPNAIEHAVQNCRDIDLNLVQAQETRRVLDRLAGYTMSPLLWKKIAKGLSAGRVQSVAMSAIVRRERARLAFVKAQFCGCSSQFCLLNAKSSFLTLLSAVDGERMVRGNDFDDSTGQLKASMRKKGLVVFDREAMQAFRDRLDMGSAVVRSVEKKRTIRNPPAPLITSTLQQECGNKLGMGAGRTMRIAQKLYENGLITYMRTDNPSLSEQAVQACQEAITNVYGKDYVWDGKRGPRRVKPKASQAAHEAIRPAGSSFSEPSKLGHLEKEERDVYELIWTRTLASQMKYAQLDQTTIKIDVTLRPGGSGSVAEFKATGSVVVNPGFLKAHRADEITQGTSSFLPNLSEGDELVGSKLSVLEHETKPLARYNDATLVKELEEGGVGRPSTYASIIEKLITRGYVFRGRSLPEEKAVPARALVPSLSAFAVESLLAKHFPSFVDAEFTARMEEALDEIAAGTADRTKYLQKYYCGEEGLAASVERTEKEIDGRSFRQISLPNMPVDMLAPSEASSKRKPSTAKRPKGKKLVAERNSPSPVNNGEMDWSDTRVLVSSYGPYVEQHGSVVASLPKSTLADDLSADRLSSILQIAKDPELGIDPETGKTVLLKTSRYGPYVQLGRAEDYPDGVKPKRCGLFPGMDVGNLTVELASKLLSLPRFLGNHAKTGEEIKAGLGPYGPYVVHGETYVSLKKGVHDVLEIRLDEAVVLLDAADHRKMVRREKQAQKKTEAELKKSAKPVTSKKRGGEAGGVKQSAGNGKKTTSKQTASKTTARQASRAS